MFKFKLLAIKNTKGAKDSLELCNLFAQLGVYLSYYSCENDSGYYIIKNGIVEHIDDCNINETEYAKFTFSAFKTKYPYVLDEIINLKNGESVRIFNMYWNGDEMVYEGNSDNGEILDIKLKDIILKPDININNEIINKKLAIKGHPTRTKEVIELLEMMGGNNFYEYDGKCVVDIESLYLFIADDNFIRYGCSFNDNFVIFTLEEFLEKYPYKVWDKVCFQDDLSTPFTINKMWWDENAKELLCSFVEDDIEVPVDGVRAYKEKTMEKETKFGTASNPIEIKSNANCLFDEEKTMEDNEETLVGIDLTQEKSKAEEIEVILGDYEFVLKDGKAYFVKKKPQYPKTYKECCDVIDYNLFGDTIIGYKANVLRDFQKLIICRDAYWHTAGEEMGLGKPWEPDWKNPKEAKYGIINNNDGRCESTTYVTSMLLAFPTPEMRDAFFENFKDLIEQCKELL